MMHLINYLLQMKRNQKGQGMVEYGLIIGLIAIVVIVALAGISGGLNNLFGQISSVLNDPAAAAATPTP